MSQNLEKWNAMARPPASALKEIRGGRLQGMTDVNPQWRYQVMTEQFGPCGIGWKYTIDKTWTEPGADGEVMAFAQVSVQTQLPETSAAVWSDPIVGIGGNHLISKEKSGLRGNDECWKMAVTDALSVALKMLGVAADVYAGLWDGSKYVERPSEPVTTVKPDTATKKLRAVLPADSDACYIEKVVPKRSGNREWADVILSTGETVVARAPQAISLCMQLAQESQAVVVTSHKNGKGNTELDTVNRWPRPDDDDTGPNPVSVDEIGF